MGKTRSLCFGGQCGARRQMRLPDDWGRVTGQSMAVTGWVTAVTGG